MTPAAPRRAQCVSIGTAVPDRRLTNADLERLVATDDAWITSRTGISERRVVEPGTPLSALAIPAARQCLERAGVPAAEVDGIIVATITGDRIMPATANLVQHGIGAVNAWGYDLVNACNGFLAALASASAMIESGHARRILVVGGDVMSSIVDYADRNTCILFGDGCGAVLLAAGPGDGPGVRGFRMRSDGSGGADLMVADSGSVRDGGARPLLRQNGRAVFTHAVRGMAEIADELLKGLGLNVGDVDLLVPHQANRRIIEAVAERFRLPMERVVVNLDLLGNTTAATLPLALAEAERDGRLRAGSRVLLVAFGGGFAWGACYLTWGTGERCR
jgi:3-oxoacyl-[acyl-carrier-protein] synthase-3